MTKARSMMALLLALAVFCTSACIYVNTKDAAPRETQRSRRATEAEHRALSEKAEEAEILRDRNAALERENAELAEQVRALERALEEARGEGAEHE